MTGWRQAAGQLIHQMLVYASMDSSYGKGDPDGPLCCNAHIGLDVVICAVLIFSLVFGVVP